jgi:hypothetical protein
MFLNWSFYISGVVGVLFMLSIGIFFLKATFPPKNSSAKRGTKPLIIRFVFCAIFFINIAFSDYLMSRIIRNEVVPFFQNASVNTRVYINSTPADDPNNIIAILSEVKPYTAHHSHALDTFEVRVETNGQTLTLRVGRDSSYKNEYWVMFPGFRHSSPEIGRITTNIFDNIP